VRPVPEAWTASYLPERPRYRRRDPEATVLHAVFRRHLEPLLARLEGEGRPLPGFVTRQLRAYLRCGILAHGFHRWRCEDCGRSRLVAFSCGSKVCPSCAGRWMAQTAANLVDHVFPREAPVRQWVLTLPFRLRFLAAFDHELKQELLRVFERSLSAWYRARARERGVKRPQAGGVVFVQRFSSNLGLFLHFHALVLEGCVDRSDDAAPAFVPSRPPTDDDVAWVAARVARWAERVLERRGLADRAGVEAAVDDFSQDEPALATVSLAAARGTHALDGPWARPVERLRGASKPRVRRRGRLCAEAEGFNLHAATFVPQHRSRRLERLCNYVARPPISDDRLTLLDDGHVAVRLKSSWSDGTTAIILPPEELICRLAALIPRPFENGLVYFGVLAANAKLRAEVVPGGREHVRSNPGTLTRIPWADLIYRAFGLDVRRCDCGGRFELIAEIHDPDVIRAILASMGLPTEPLHVTPARPPPDDDELDWAA